MRSFLTASLLLLLTGCASMEAVDPRAQRSFTYDYSVENTSKNDLYERARDYFATAYRDSDAVLKVQDKDSGTLTGKGVASWLFGGTAECFADYNIRFMAKEGKARLNLEMLQGDRGCGPYGAINKPGYDHIVAEFKAISNELGAALNSQGAFSDF